MIIEAWCKTDKGLRRESNQDSFLVNKDLGLYIVADGMGGHNGGEVASSLAVQTMEEVLSLSACRQMEPRQALLRSIEEANRKIYQKASEAESKLVGMGTTLVAAYIRDKRIYIANVGDSRCYLYIKPNLWQLTEDHSLINEQIRAGVLNEQQVRNFVGRNVITRSVGYELDVMPDIIERNMSAGETYIICSDGLSSIVPDEKIIQCLNNSNISEFSEKCLQLALSHGGDDNVTVLVIHLPLEK